MVRSGVRGRHPDVAGSHPDHHGGRPCRGAPRLGPVDEPGRLDRHRRRGSVAAQPLHQPPTMNSTQLSGKPCWMTHCEPAGIRPGCAGPPATEYLLAGTRNGRYTFAPPGRGIPSGAPEIFGIRWYRGSAASLRRAPSPGSCPARSTKRATP